ncbi:hypothetical protein T01_6712 [Trichinella spiralis]|uniref:Uncharacterized protein n=1 Tax=Trichinella spiralis TaxID=6334 RepID=A0A0V1BSU6_TRISP|nr:hypothetical protein T01_6712 [Trichinella spiralis]
MVVVNHQQQQQQQEQDQEQEQESLFNRAMTFGTAGVAGFSVGFGFVVSSAGELVVMHLSGEF